MNARVGVQRKLTGRKGNFEVGKRGEIEFSH